MPCDKGILGATTREMTEASLSHTNMTWPLLLLTAAGITTTKLRLGDAEGVCRLFRAGAGGGGGWKISECLNGVVSFLFSH